MSPIRRRNICWRYLQTHFDLRVEKHLVCELLLGPPSSFTASINRPSDSANNSANNSYLVVSLLESEQQLRSHSATTGSKTSVRARVLNQDPEVTFPAEWEEKKSRPRFCSGSEKDKHESFASFSLILSNVSQHLLLNLGAKRCRNVWTSGLFSHW